jgi:hypothetical protein
MAVLLSLSAVASFVLPDHVLNRLHTQYTLIRLNLYHRKGAKYDLVVLLGKLVLDNVFGPAHTHFSASRPEPPMGRRWHPRLTFAKNTTATACPAIFPRSC